MMNICTRLAAAFAVGMAGLLGVSAASATTLNTPYSFVEKVENDNDCSGLFGQGFENCVYNRSPIIAKFNFPGATELNTTVFPGITSAMFTIVNNGSSGTWSYNGTTGVAITAFVLKAGNDFAIFKMTTPGTSFTNVNWDTALGFLTNNNGGAKDLSHISFYDTRVSAVPVPAAGLMLLVALGGIAAVRSRKRA